MKKRLKKYKYEDFRDEKSLNKLYGEIQRFIKKRCKTDDVGDLPVAFMLRSRKLHYPFNDAFLMPTSDAEIERAMELAIANASIAMDRVYNMSRIKTLIKNEKNVP